MESQSTNEYLISQESFREANEIKLNGKIIQTTTPHPLEAFDSLDLEDGGVKGKKKIRITANNKRTNKHFPLLCCSCEKFLICRCRV